VRGPRALPRLAAFLAADCKAGDTSGSCRIVNRHVTIIFHTCPAGQKPCPPTVIHTKADANHPFGFDVVVPAANATTPLASVKRGVFAVIVPVPTGKKSLTGKFSVQVIEDPSGAIDLQVFAADGTRPAIWSPPLIFVAPAGFTRLQGMTRAGWFDIRRREHIVFTKLGVIRTWSIETPGMYRWAK
jgi:hypothetical protein